MDRHQQFALRNALPSAAQPLDPRYFWDRWPLRFGLTVNY